MVIRDSLIDFCCRARRLSHGQPANQPPPPPPPCSGRPSWCRPFLGHGGRAVRLHSPFLRSLHLCQARGGSSHRRYSFFGGCSKINIQRSSSIRRDTVAPAILGLCVTDLKLMVSPWSSSKGVSKIETPEI